MSIAERFRKPVIDANVVFAALIAKGGTFRVFVTNKILRKFYFGLEYLFIEIREHLTKYLKRLNFLKKN